MTDRDDGRFLGCASLAVNAAVALCAVFGLLLSLYLAISGNSSTREALVLTREAIEVSRDHLQATESSNTRQAELERPRLSPVFAMHAFIQGDEGALEPAEPPSSGDGAIEFINVGGVAASDLKFRWYYDEVKGLTNEGTEGSRVNQLSALGLFRPATLLAGERVTLWATPGWVTTMKIGDTTELRRGSLTVYYRGTGAESYQQTFDVEAVGGTYADRPAVIVTIQRPPLQASLGAAAADRWYQPNRKTDYTFEP